MAEFLITGPNGKKYRVTGDSAEGALSALQKHLGGQSSPSVGMGTSIGRGAAQGATFGLADEIVGGGAQKKAMLGAATDRNRLSAMQDAAQAKDWDRYRGLQKEVFSAGQDAQVNRQDQYRANDASARKANPKLFIAGEIAGGIVPSVLGIGAAGNMARGTGLAGRSLAMGAAGGAEAGVYGFNQGEGGKDRVVQALTSAPAGAAMGAAIPGIGTLIGKGVRRLGSNVPRNVSDIAKTLQRDKMTMDQGVAKLREMGPGAMPVDLGPNMTQLGKGVARLPGEGQTIMRDAIGNRVESAKNRMTMAVDDAFGPRQNQAAAQNAAKSARRVSAKAAYGDAFANNWGESGPPFALDDILPRLDASDFKQAQAIARAEGRPFGKTILADIADDGSIAFKRKPSLEEAELLRRALKDRVDAAYRAGRGGEGEALKSLERELRGVIDDNSDLSAIRAKYASDSAAIEARDTGRKLFSNSVDLDELELAYPRMSDAEKAALREGARSNIADIMDTASQNAQDSARRMRTDRNTDKLRLVLDENKSDTLLRNLENERAKQLVNNQITSGSDTAANQAAMDMLGASPNKKPSGAVRSAFNLQFGDAGGAILDKLSEARLSAKGETARKVIAEMLTDPGKLAQAAMYGPQMKQLSAREKMAAEIAQTILQSAPRTISGQLPGTR